MTQAERRLCDWQYGRAGDFLKALYDLMARAAPENFAKFEIGFPEDAEVIKKYKKSFTYFNELTEEYFGNTNENTISRAD
jgi:hypothetical protein